MINSFLKLPRSFNGICTIYPPTINEVVDENTKNLINLLTISSEELEDYFADKTDKNGDFIDPPAPFDYLIINAMYNKEFEKKIIQSFELFLHEKVNILYKGKIIIVGDLQKEILKAKSLQDFRIIDENNFFDFQNCLREAIGEEQLEPPKKNEDPRIKRMKAKARYRDRIKAKKGLGITFEETLVSICCMGIGLNPLNIGEISYAAAKKLVEKYQQKEKYEIDIRSLLAGADSKKIKVEYWMNKSK